MRLLRLILFLAAFSAFMASGVMLSHSGMPCPVPKPGEEEERLDQPAFLAAHGLSQEQFSFWLREHSVWRNEHSEDLKEFSFIPQDYDPHRSE